jgi:hypothetical protein
MFEIGYTTLTMDTYLMLKLITIFIVWLIYDKI